MKKTKSNIAKQSLRCLGTWIMSKFNSIISLLIIYFLMLFFVINVQYVIIFYGNLKFGHYRFGISDIKLFTLWALCHLIPTCTFCSFCHLATTYCFVVLADDQPFIYIRFCKLISSSLKLNVYMYLNKVILQIKYLFIIDI